MGGTYCCVPGCSSTSYNPKEKVSWHFFPGNKKIKLEWIRRINRRNRNGTLWTPNYFSRICGKHFNKSGKKESHNKYPIYFPNRTISENTVRQVHIYEDFELGENVQIGKQEDLNILLQVNSMNLMTKDSSLHHEHTYAKSGDNLNELEANKVTINNLEMKIQSLIHEHLIKEKEQNLEQRKLASENNVLTSKLEHLKTKKLENNLIQRLKEDNNLLRFYTGFANNTRFNIFKDFIKPGYDLARRMTFKNVERYAAGNLILNFEEQIVLVLMRMRLALLEQDLAFRFSISTSTVSRIWSFWINLLYSQLSQVPNWPNKTLINKYMPDSFRDLYPNTRIILDCTEILIEVPSDFGVQSSTYSTYKSHNTAKGLIGITPNGFISFVSELYPGRTTDKQIFEECGLMEKLEPGDEVMADRGFTLEEVLKKKNITLNIPPFLRKKQFDEEEVEETRDIAKLRVHVERVIGHVKTFKILKNMYSNCMHDKLNQIWHVCCLLLNFVNEPLLDISEIK